MFTQEFGQKLSSLLADQSVYFRNADIQTDIFNIFDTIDEDEMNEEQVALIKDSLAFFLKLSFVMKNHRKDTQRLIQFLENETLPKQNRNNIAPGLNY